MFTVYPFLGVSRLAGNILRPCPLPAAGQRVLLVDLHPADREAAGVQQKHAALPGGA